MWSITFSFNSFSYSSQISSNGYITVDKAVSSRVIKFPTTHTTLSPYSIDMISNGNDIFYRETTNTAVLETVDRDIALLLSKNASGPTIFNTRKAVIVTYSNVASYSSSSTRLKYQAVIATDYRDTFTIVNYHRLDQTGSGSSGFFERGTCQINTKLFSNSFDKRALTTTSNVGVQGKHIYQLSYNTDDDDCFNRGGTIHIVISYY